ncbi:hypothetical protein, partial [Candidatus Enterococcus testudinis]|uniref:hypothetical protein n=1 Tax=Candidatus Enterococcus testudinis TaxID=1834191 RepID=UPI001C501389
VLFIIYSALLRKSIVVIHSKKAAPFALQQKGRLMRVTTLIRVILTNNTSTVHYDTWRGNGRITFVWREPNKNSEFIFTDCRMSPFSPTGVSVSLIICYSSRQRSSNSIRNFQKL